MIYAATFGVNLAADLLKWCNFIEMDFFFFFFFKKKFYYFLYFFFF